MNFLGFGKKRGVLDLTEQYRYKQERVSKIKEEVEKPATPFSIFGDNTQSFNSNNESTERPALGIEERRRRLINRLKNLTEQIDSLSSQLYKLQQRVEVLERKSGSGFS